MTDHKTETDAAPGDAPALTTRQVVLETCRQVALDKSQPAAARVQAARTLAEMAGYLGKVQTAALDTGESRHAEMTPQDIDRELQRLSTRTAN